MLNPRAIERYLLAPLATTIVNRQVPAGDQFLLVTGHDDRLDLEFIDPDAPQAAAEVVVSLPAKRATAGHAAAAPPTSRDAGSGASPRG